MTDAEFFRRMQNELGVRPPHENEQDWAFQAGNALFTEDYIRFYSNEDLTRIQKEHLINMILQGVENLCCVHFSEKAIDRLWNKIVPLLKQDGFEETIRYWANPDEPLEQSFCISGRMRELL